MLQFVIFHIFWIKASLGSFLNWRFIVEVRRVGREYTPYGSLLVKDSQTLPQKMCKNLTNKKKGGFVIRAFPNLRLTAPPSYPTNLPYPKVSRCSNLSVISAPSPSLSPKNSIFGTNGIVLMFVLNYYMLIINLFFSL